jgi:hypothetical protein
VERLEEVLRLQEVGNPVERIVVDENGAQQALLGLDLERSAQKDRRSRIGSELEDVRISQSHAFRFGRCQDFCKGGGDKAPVPEKAEAKAGRYAPFFKNVDESGARAPRSLTGFRSKPGDPGAFPRKCRTKS